MSKVLPALADSREERACEGGGQRAGGKDQPRGRELTLRRWSLVVASSSVVEAVAVLHHSLVRSDGGDRREQPNNRQRTGKRPNVW